MLLATKQYMLKKLVKIKMKSFQIFVFFVGAFLIDSIDLTNSADIQHDVLSKNSNDI